LKQQSVIDHAIDLWQVCLNACVKAKWRAFSTTLSIICYREKVFCFSIFK